MIAPMIHENPADNATPCGTNPTLSSPIAPDGTPEIGQRYTIPARQGRAVRLARGQSIRIINTHGTQVCDTWAFNATNRAEYLSWPHARAWINRALPIPGDALVTNRRRPILTLTEDTSPGVHDTLIAACDLFRYMTLGVNEYHDNCADNLRMAMMAIGLTVPEVPQPFNVWMNIPLAADWTIDWLPPVARPGDRVTLRAEMDCIVVMSACPQDLVPINGENMTPVELQAEVVE
jgi:uncharacterized protein YcgI (DUF1989 family)